ncbi:MAG TPA: hypothetical protein ENK28_08945 [Aliiroseovarius sp.]|nr:hypothetical protein [Aliiroseovarius sp.]
MIRAARPYLLALLLAITGLSFAQARGTSPDVGVEMVICSGISMRTVIIGADGQPVEKTHICPDGSFIFAADFALPQMIAPTPRLLALVQPNTARTFLSRHELTPSARGPPDLV